MEDWVWTGTLDTPMQHVRFFNIDAQSLNTGSDCLLFTVIISKLCKSYPRTPSHPAHPPLPFSPRISSAHRQDPGSSVALAILSL